MENYEGLKQKLAMANRILVNENLTELGRGHVVYKISDNRILIPGHLHDYQRSIADCTASDIVTIDYDGKVIEGRYPESMHEFYFYSAMFRRRPELKAALHMHAFYSNLIGMSGEDMLFSSRDSFLFTEGIAVYSGLPLFVNTEKMGEEMADLLGSKDVLLHRGHGVFMVGRSIEEVVTRAAALERAARKSYYLRAIGKFLEFPLEDIERSESAEIREELQESDWGYFLTRVEKRGTVL
ncbi:MAG: class II aldolase/adducin family protein [Candidatus Thermoplasmatota archaeon]|jgi:ribulose-5-phosphate 4-epimerase/fuculose-1-phosphate aldolase|nr:class II aldolase/adducin family protein [Candidatus Thermoplasmatota archaeon]